LNVRRVCFLLLVWIAVILMSACSSTLVDSDQPALVSEEQLAEGQALGQSFVAQHGGLAGIELYLRPTSPCHQGKVHLSLKDDPFSGAVLVTSSLPTSAIQAPGFYRFPLDPIGDSHSQYYYASVTTEDDECGAIRVGLAPADTYLNGSAYRGDVPFDGQLAFRLVYSRWHLAVDLVRFTGTLIVTLGIALLLYLVPGYGLLAALSPYQNICALARFTIALALGLALYPVLFLWTGLIGLRLGSGYALLPVFGGLVSLTWRYKPWRTRQALSVHGVRMAISRLASLPNTVFAVAVAALVVSRFLPVRGLEAPMWGDSYQHTVMAQLLVDNKGVFQSWLPYVPLRTFTYHFGFHSLVAVFHWLTGEAVTKSVIVVGQVLNVLAVIAVAGLVSIASKNRWARVAAVVAAGLLSPMPSFYVNWGRYTQLAGQAILPGAMVATWLLLTRKTPRRSAYLAGAVILGGLGVTHYRVLLFYVVFAGVAWILASSKERIGLVRRGARLCVLGVVGGAVFFPQYLKVRQGGVLDIVGQQLGTASGGESAFMRQYNAIGDITTYMAPELWLATIVAIGIVLWQRNRLAAVVAAWWLALFVATNPAILGLPGTGVITNFALFIATYIPAGVFLGLAMGPISERVGRWPRGELLMAVVLLSVTIVAARARMRDVDPHSHALVTKPDLQAMRWIEENTPESARFLANSFFAYGGSVIVGSDAGWWIPLLAHRGNTVPPLTYASERAYDDNYLQEVNALAASIWAKGATNSEIVEGLLALDIRYAYIGQRQGSVNWNERPYLVAEDLKESQHYRTVYHKDRVWVFEIVP